MKTDRDTPLTTLASGHALAAVRAGQAALGKAFYEFRGLPQANAIAELRLVYSVLERTLFEAVRDESSAPVEPDGATGDPFSCDPRTAIFGIEAKLALDSLRNSDAALFQRLAPEAGALGIDAQLLTDWQAASAAFGPNRSARESAAPGSEAGGSDQGSYPLCG